MKSLPDRTEHRVGFTTEVLLQLHIKTEHQNCMFCEYKSSTQGELVRHIEMHHSGKTVEDRKDISCPHDKCPKKFTRRSNLNAHIRTAHQGVRFVCGQEDLSEGASTTTPELEGWSNDRGCGEKFFSKVRLEDHIKYVHLGLERPRAPEPKSATGSTDLISEISGVTKQKQANQLVACPSCPDMFLRYADLEKHIGRIHEHHPDADPAEFLSPTQVKSKQSYDADQEAQDWLDDEAKDMIDDVNEEIFAAEMDYGAPKDDWLEDEVNILLLARAVSPLPEENIDPALMWMS